MRKLLIGLLAALLTTACVADAQTNANNPPRGMLGSKWLGGNLVIYPGDVAGNMYFVDSNNGSDTNGGTSWNDALATIDAAVNKCTASNDDWIVVHPAHTEDLDADSAVDIDVAGVTVYGIRHGRQMPTLDATAAAGDVKLAAAGVTLHNIRITGGIDATTGVIEVSSTDCAVIDCEYRDVTGQATDVLITTAAADRLLIDGFRLFGAAGAGGNSGIALVGADDAEVRNFWLYGNFATGAIDCRTTKSERIHIHSGAIWTENSNDLAVDDNATSSTGFIGPDLMLMLQDDAANVTEAITGATFMVFDPVYVCNAANQKALLINWTAVADS